MKRSEKFAIAASGFLGVRFRLHGRDPSAGLDCVGLVVASLREIGIEARNPQGYTLRNRAIDRWLCCAGHSELYTINAPVAAGDVLLVRAGPEQYHVLVAECATSVIHAHAGLGRVVRQPLADHHRFEAQWRLPD